MKHTPGQWRWTKQFTGQWALMTGRSLLVMDFVRQGMNGAQPRFSDRNGEPRGGLMHKAEDLDLATHPDATLIAAAPDLLEACKGVDEVYAALQSALPVIAGTSSFDVVTEAVRKARAAIAKAEGAQP